VAGIDGAHLQPVHSSIAGRCTVRQMVVLSREVVYAGMQERSMLVQRFCFLLHVQTS
jgi:hypothetical protein